MLGFRHSPSGSRLLRAFSSSSLRQSKELLGNSQLWQPGSFIDGEFVYDSSQGSTFDVLNPATGSVLTTMPRHGATETTLAIDAAHRAWPDWKKKTMKERSKILKRLFDLIDENKDDLATIMTLESGKPLAEAKGEMLYANSFVELYAEECKRIKGEVIPAPLSNRRLLSIKEPVGPCALITPWNFPAAMITRKLAPALAAGCTAVIKPAEQTPLTALALMELCREAGIPKGVVNCISTSRDDVVEVGSTLCHSPLIRKISFTGSTMVGKWLYRESADTMKRMSMELGGNAPFIVFEDADLEVAVNALIGCKFRNTGQTCISSNRIFVHASVYEAFVSLLQSKVSQMKQGDGMKKTTSLGPLIDDKAVHKMKSQVQDCVELGAEVVMGGKERSDLNGNGATFYEPTIITGVTPSMKPYYEETFGPIAPLFTFNTEEEVISMANDSPFGLAGYFCSQDISRIFRVAEALEVGMVGVNEGAISSDWTPFGGVKQSGLGREGGAAGIEEYLETKFICIGNI